MPKQHRNGPAWMPGQGEIEPWKASFDGFVEHRKPTRHNSYSILAAQRSTHETVYPPPRPQTVLSAYNFIIRGSRWAISRNIMAGFTSLANTYIIRGRIYTWRTIMIKNKFMALTLTVVLTAGMLTG